MEARLESDVAQLTDGASLDLLASRRGSVPEAVRERYRTMQMAGEPDAAAPALLAGRALEDGRRLPVLQQLRAASESDCVVIRRARSADICRLLLQGGTGLKGPLSRLSPGDQSDAQALLARLAAAAWEQPGKRGLWLRLVLMYGSPAATLSLFESPPLPLVKIAPLRWLYHALASLLSGLKPAVAARSAPLGVADLQRLAAWLATGSGSAPPAASHCETLVALVRTCDALEVDATQRALRPSGGAQSGGQAGEDDEDDEQLEIEVAAEGEEASGPQMRRSCTVREAVSSIAVELKRRLQHLVTGALAERLSAPGDLDAEARLCALCATSVLQHAAQAVLRPGLQAVVRELLRAWLAALGDRWQSQEGVGLLLNLLDVARWAASDTPPSPLQLPPPPSVRGLEQFARCMAEVPLALRPRLGALLAAAAVAAASELRRLGDVCQLLEHEDATRLAGAAALAAALGAATSRLSGAAAADLLRAAQLAVIYGGMPGVEAPPPGGMTGKQGRALAGALLRAVSALDQDTAECLVRVLLPSPPEPPLQMLSQAAAMEIAVGVPGAVPTHLQTGALHASSTIA